MISFRTSTSLLAVAATAVLAFSAPASATEGYFQNGYGARSKALAGAGVADSRDATAGSLNPAGLVHVGDELDVAFSVFSPRRQFTGTGAPNGFDFTAFGEHESGRDYFFLPNLAWSTRSFKNPLFDVMAFTMVGNGGMNTSYPTFPRPAPDCFGGGGAGAFCAGAGGVNMMQIFMSLAFAKQITPGISIGVAPIFALQSMDLRGLEPFAQFSVDPANVSGSRNDWSMGGGVRAGIEISPMSNVRIGVSGTTPIWMQDFEKYSGVFAEGGGFDIPASIQAGIAVDVSRQLTLMLDWRYIWYSGVDSISNPSTNLFGCPSPLNGFVGNPANCLGGSNGPGFGWSDINVIKVAAEYRANDKLTLRAGYAWNEQPISSRDVTFNVLAPAVTQHHITGGFAYDIGNGYTLEMAAMFAPNTSVTGPELSNPGHTVEIEMWQFDITAGVKYKWDEPSAPLK
ncbi:MAG: outer membrane protein transport protein [Hyphomicrobiaceae bacterium]|nr:outer membrane protein transport protein [Hyphomicrobiaceae bacterium]